MALNNINDLVPLTTNQREIWLEQELFPCSPIYNIGGYVEIKASVDYDVFSRAVKYVVEENDSLQIVLEKHEGIAHQRFVQPDGVDLHVKDFSDDEDSYSRCLAWMRKEFEKPFNLHGDHLFHFTLIKVSSELYVWFSKFHHIVIDGWSISSVVTRVGEFYTELKTNSSFQVAPGSSYKEYALQNGEYFKSGQYTKAQEYWMKTLSDAPDPLLPRFRHTVENVNQINSHKNMSLPLDFYNRITDEAASKGFSAFQFVLGAFYSYFSRIYGKEDIVFGIPVLNRRNNTEKNTVGLFVGVIPLRIQAEPDVTFLELLEIIKRKIRESFRYQHLPLSEINLCNKSRHGNEGKIFDILFSFEKIDFYSSFDGVEGLFTPMTLDREPLVIAFKDYAGRDPFLEFSYNKNYFKGFVVDRMMCHIEKVLQETFKTPDIEVSKIDYIPEEEKQLLLHGFNNTKSSYPEENTISRLFEEQVERTPDNTALVFGDKKFTYQQLNEQANRFAHCLRERYGIHPNDLVGVLLNRSEYMIIAVLGIVKAGGAYVPIDPEYPEKRIKFMLDDLCCKAVVTDGEDYDNFDTSSMENVINIKSVQGECITNPVVNSLPNDMAYVMYTSGSTGTPKGVTVAHKPVVRLVKNTNYIEISSGDRILQTGSIFFDASTFEIWGTLLNGAALYLVPLADLLKINRLGRIIRDCQITIMWLTSSFFNQIVEEDESVFCDVKHLLVGGERLSVSHINKLREANRSLNIINGYGPTENTTFTTTYKIDQIFETDIPIGTPVSNTRVYILDNNGGLSPIGFPGELCITGDGLAMGYLNHPSMTDEKFIPCPFEPGKKMYRTADITRLLPDGNIEFLGRSDNQVKIRGFRIECGEIEQTILQLPFINEAVVIVRDSENMEKELVSYIVSDREVPASDIKIHLSYKLPHYMVPSQFIQLEKMPLTRNGKIDKRALPEFGNAKLSGKSEFIGPRSSIESRISDIWKEILSRDKIDVHDNFFDIGGHSLKAVRVSSQIHCELGVEINLRTLFQHPTISSLSGVIDNREQSRYIPIRKVPDAAHYPVSHAQQRLWILDKIEENSNAYNIPASFTIKGDLDIEALTSALNQLVERHEILRTRFITIQGEPRQKIEEDKVFKITMEDLSGRKNPEEKVKTESYKHAHASFNLEKEELIRVKVLKLGNKHYMLLITLHHIICDGWSLSIFVRELFVFYKSRLMGMNALLEPLPVQYKDYSAWHNEMILNGKLKDAGVYWHTKLSGEIPVLSLPTDLVRPLVQSFQGDRINFIISKENTDSLRELCKANGVSLFMFFVALVKVLLYRYSSQEDIIVGSPVAGRQHKDLEGQIGYYVNTLALRDKVMGKDSFRSLLKQVKKTVTNGFDHQEYPFDTLVDELAVKREVNRSPLFDVMVTHQNIEEIEFRLPGVEISQTWNDYLISKFDLTFSFSELEEEVECSIEYNTSLFHEDRIQRAKHHLMSILRSILADSEECIDDINIIPESEKNKLLYEFNSDNKNSCSDKTLSALFEEQVEQTPDNIAVVFEDRELTYRELNRKANCLAHCLRKLYHVQPDDLVGVLLDRSENMIIALLGILKSDGAYVAIDPEYPDERIKFVVEDARCKVIVTQENLTTKLGGCSGTIIDINNVSEQRDTNLTHNALPENFAYVIYTSGSTGKPKGTLVTNDNVVRLFKSTESIFHFTSSDAWSFFHSIAFDFSVWEIFGALLYGGRLVVVPFETARSPFDFYEFLVKDKVTVLNQTPSAFKQLIPVAVSQESKLSLKYVIFGGEALDTGGLDLWFNRYHDKQTELVNMYGITETTVHVTSFAVTQRSIQNKKSILVGKPLQDLKIDILDKSRNLVPIGVTGEIYVSGAGVAGGYLNQSELTAERFLENPFRSGERMYQTGDLGMWLPDGNILYTGRIDNQVKIRGYRIECGEIEYALLQHPLINEAVVVFSDDGMSGMELSAYIVCEEEIPLQHVRKHLSGRLPDYMVPSYFFQLDKMPLTRNGKIDKKELSGFTPIESDIYVPPENELEQDLTLIWKKFLKTEQIGVTDNFFDLGGNSLLLIKVFFELGKKYNGCLQMTDLFAYPTISELASYLTTKEPDNTIQQKFNERGVKQKQALVKKKQSMIKDRRKHSQDVVK